MRHFYITLAFLAALLAFSGCSSKEYYKPKDVAGDWPLSRTLPASIVDNAYDGAVLENGEILTKKGESPVMLPQGYRFIGSSDGWIVAGSIDGTLLLIDENGSRTQQRLELGKTVAAAAVQGDILAVLFSSNEKALYALSTQELLYKESGSAPSAVDSRIANPYFLNELVLFLTLDGKIDIVSSQTHKLLRSMIVSSEEHFNNIIYFNVVDNTLFAATTYRLLSLADREMRASYELRDVLFNKEGIWLSTKQGEVIALTPSLQLKAKQKFPFAHFLAMALVDEKLYLLEREGYLIEMDKDLQNYRVYDVAMDDGFIFASEHAFYVDDTTIELKR